MFETPHGLKPVDTAHFIHYVLLLYISRFVND